MAGKTLDAGVAQEAAPAPPQAVDLKPVLTRLAMISDTQLTELKGLENLQQTLDEDVLEILRQLQQRPALDVEAMLQAQRETIDAVDRVMMKRIPRLVSRRWWMVWLWLIAGVMLGWGGCWLVTQTALGKQMVARAWPQKVLMQVLPQAVPQNVPAKKGK